MNSKEIKEALEIIKKPITVNCVEYKYFNEENYNKLIEVYENCLWFANNFEQINLTIENLQKENQQLKEQLQNKQDIINGILDYIDSNKFVEEFKNVVNERNVRNEILNRIEKSDN